MNIVLCGLLFRSEIRKQASEKLHQATVMHAESRRQKVVELKAMRKAQKHSAKAA
jgi:hypothetical protein